MDFKYLKWFFVLTAILSSSFLIVGMFKGYSPVPHWDMWDGYLDFYVKLSDGDMWQWLSQHNEHRIFFSRILFWVDIHFFNGSIWFLLLANFSLLIVFTYMITFVSAKELGLYSAYSTSQSLIIFSLLLMFCMSWMQNNNLTWGFQSQFIAAYLFPFITFYALYRYAIYKNWAWFGFALFMGCMSAGTMANGILTLPLLFLLALFLRLRFLELIVIGFFAILINVLYFYNFQELPGHGSLTKTLIEHPVDFVIYFLTYLGNPFYYLLFKEVLGAQIFGFAFVITTVASFFYVLLRMEKSEHKNFLLALFAYLLYVGGTAFATSGGRAIFGVEQAVSSRYTTPVIFAWASLALVMFFILKKKLKANKKAFYFLALMPLLLLIIQVEALGNNKQKHFNHMVAGLAMEMGVRDETYLMQVFPFMDWLQEMIVVPKKRNLSIFGNSVIKDVESLIGSNYRSNYNQVIDLTGHLDEQVLLNTDSFYTRVSGWIYDSEFDEVPSSVIIVNQENQIVGYAITGGQRQDVADHLNRKYAKYSGFVGYVKQGEYGELSFIDANRDKKISFTLEKQLTLNIAKNWNLSLFDENMASASDIDLTQITWKQNATFDYQNQEGFIVFGSYVEGDDFVGEIVLNLMKGNLFVYKTGPNSNGQFISFETTEGMTLFVSQLPVSRNWTAIKLDNEILPEKFNVRIQDTGSGWGQWSAILLKN